MKENVQKYAGLVLLMLFGMLQITSSLGSLCILCAQPDHWDWLSRDPEVLDYLNITWRWMGVNGLAFAILTIAVLVTGYRKGERWAWFAMWTWPAFLIAQGIVFPFTWPEMRILLVIAAAGLFVPYRRFFPKTIV